MDAKLLENHKFHFSWLCWKFQRTKKYVITQFASFSILRIWIGLWCWNYRRQKSVYDLKAFFHYQLNVKFSKSLCYDGYWKTVKADKVNLSRRGIDFFTFLWEVRQNFCNVLIILTSFLKWIIWDFIWNVYVLFLLQSLDFIVLG